MRHGLGEILAESGDLTLRRLRRASEWRRVHGGTIDRALLATSAVSEEKLLEALSRATGISPVERRALLAAEPEALELLPREARHRLRALPFRIVEDVLFVATSDPGNPVLETGLIASTGREVMLFVTADPILEDVLAHWEAVEGPEVPLPVPTVPIAVPPSPEPPPSRAAESAADPFARLARALLAEAVDQGALSAEIGADRKGGYLKTLTLHGPGPTRSLPRPVLNPLITWLLEHSKGTGPFDSDGLVVERGGKRSHVEVTVTSGSTAWLVFGPRRPVARAGEAEICLHEGSAGDAFCARCGAAL